MKRLFVFTVIFGLMPLASCAQKLKDSQVPDIAKSAFKKQYPNTVAQWEKEEGSYEVNFKIEGKPMSAVIDSKGRILETESDIPVTDLPATAKSYIDQHYKGVKVKEASKIMKANGEVTYEALINGKDVIFDANGKFMKGSKEAKD